MPTLPRRSALFPFAAVVGMDDLKLALVLNAVSPTIGGVLVRGEKGTAKSTVVRALAALLPPLRAVEGCRFGCDPELPDPTCPDGPHPADAPAGTRAARLVELPVGAAEDRVVGSLDLERALTEGVQAFAPGLLAAAHRGVLYVDEVNLLHDHLVDVLLDAAAMGRCYVEREGVSVSHAARFLLVGTMNPEEGELRPQLLDRFGLTVQVAATREPAERAEIVRRGLAYEADPAAFAAAWAEADAALAARIAVARAAVGGVVLPDAELYRIAVVCAAFGVDGLRADLVTARAAIAHAAWAGRSEVTEEDVRAAARLALPHRRRRDPFDAPGIDEDQLDKALQDGGPPPPPTPPDGDGPGSGAPDPGASGHAADGAAGSADAGSADAGPAGAGSSDGGAPGTAGPAAGPPAPERVAAPGDPFRTRLFTVPGVGTGAAGRRSRARTSAGRTTGSRRLRPREPGPVHLPATLRAAAPYQLARHAAEPDVPVGQGAEQLSSSWSGGGPGGFRFRLHGSDLRAAVREGREGNLVLFCVDASGSMAARARMGAVKGAVLSLLLDAYQRRDKVGLVTFRGGGARLELPPTSSVEAGAARLRALPTGGRTPLAAGLAEAARVLALERLRDPDRRPLLVVVTDGRATDGADPGPAAARLAGDGVAAVVVDCESGRVRLGLAAALAVRLGGQVVQLDELAAGELAGVVRGARAGAA